MKAFENCRGCQSPLVPGHAWQSMSVPEQAKATDEGRKQHHSRGMCGSCYYWSAKTGQLPPRLIGAARSASQECRDCGVATWARKAWWSLTAEQRASTDNALRYRNGQCSECAAAARRGRPRKTWKLEHLIEEAEHLFGYGASADEVAKRLNLQHNSLAKAFERARKRDLTTRRIPYSFRSAA